MAYIELINLTKDYKQGKNTVRALDGVSLQIEGGEFVSIVGRSGSGKTTLLDILGMLLRPTSGILRIDRVDTATLGDTKRAAHRSAQIGFIFQEYNLLASLNVIDNVMLPLRYSEPRSRDGRKRALELLEKVGLGDNAKNKPNELSGGQQQRVAIARALINRPAVVLGDEPTGAVDTQTSQELLSLMRHLNRDEGVTFIIVTHDLELAAQTDRMIRLKDGRVVGDHTVERQTSTAASLAS